MHGHVSFQCWFCFAILLTSAARRVYGGHRDRDPGSNSLESEFSSQFRKVIYACVPQLKDCLFGDLDALIYCHIARLLELWPVITPELYHGQETLYIMPEGVKLQSESMLMDEDLAGLNHGEDDYDEEYDGEVPMTAAASGFLQGAKRATQQQMRRPAELKQQSRVPLPSSPSDTVSPVLNRKRSSTASDQAKLNDDSDGGSDDEEESDDEKDASPKASRKRKAVAAPEKLPMFELLKMKPQEFFAKHGVLAVPQFHDLFSKSLQKDNKLSGGGAFLIFMLLIQLGKVLPFPRPESGKLAKEANFKPKCFAWILLRFRCLHERHLNARFQQVRAEGGIAWDWTTASKEAPFAKTVEDGVCRSLEPTITDLRTVSIKTDKGEGYFLPDQWGFNLNTAVHTLIKVLLKAMLDAILPLELKRTVIESAEKKSQENTDSFFKTAFRSAVVDWIKALDPLQFVDMKDHDVLSKGGADEFCSHLAVLIVLSKYSKDRVPISPSVREPERYRDLFGVKAPKKKAADKEANASDPPLKKGRVGKDGDVSKVSMLLHY